MFTKRHLLAVVLLTLALFSTPVIAGAATDPTLAEPTLQRYDKGGKSYSAPFDEVVVLAEGETLTLAGASTPGGRVTLIVGTKSIDTDGVSDGSWATVIKADDLPAGADTVVGQTVIDSRTSELANLLKIEVKTAADTADSSETTTPKTGTPIAYIIAAVAIVLAALGVGIWLFGKKRSSAKRN